MNCARTFLLALVLLGGFPAALLRAQVCAGFPSLRDTRFRVAASAASYTYATALSVSFTAGKTVFGTVGVGRTRDSELDASTFDLRLEAGVDAADRERRVFLCPVAALSVSLGPNDILLSRTDYRYLEGALGFGVAAVAARSPRFAVLAAGGLRAVRLTATRTFRGSETLSWTVSDTYWLVSFGIGFVLNGVLTIRPSVTVPFDLVPPGNPDEFAVPFGREEREVSLGISVGINFGGRTRPSP